MDKLINLILQTAFTHLNDPKLNRILHPSSDARVIFPEFNPFRAMQPIAIVEWPGFNSQRKEVVFTHLIRDNDPILHAPQMY